MVISHNGTEGIDSIMVYLSLTNMSTTEPVLLRRSFSVAYRWTPFNISSVKSLENGTNAIWVVESAERSGHPGYLVGKAVRAGYRHAVEDPTRPSADAGGKRVEGAAPQEKIRLSAPRDMLSLFGPGEAREHP